MKKRLTIAGCVLFLSAGLVLPVLALDIHALLSREMGALTLSPIAGWQAVWHTGQVRMLYLFLFAALGLSLLWAVISSSSLQYRSDMQCLTPDIATPCASGQGQYGTARWLSKKKYAACFTVVNLENVPELDALLAAGRQERKDIDAKR